MPPMHKRRSWQAVLAVSASGPEFSLELERNGLMRPRMAANLRYTTADVDYLETSFQDGDYDSGEEELHRRLRNPTRAELFSTLEEIGAWLSAARSDPRWDGGGLLFCFAGHGREGDGALVLEDDVVTPEAFVSVLARLAEIAPGPGRLRVSVILDSCHSAAFVLRLLDACFVTHEDTLVPFHAFASCMEDEFALEDPGLGHGMFTYSFSVEPGALASATARAIQPDNTFGPSLAIAGGELGCSVLTAGRQNPLLYWNGAGHLHLCGQSIPLFPGGRYVGVNAARAQVLWIRDHFADVVRPMRPDFRIGKVRGDADMRRLIQEQLRSIRSREDGP